MLELGRKMLIEEVDILRDIAIKLKPTDPMFSHALLKIATKHRPDGKFIKKQIIELEKNIFPEIIFSVRSDGLTERINGILKSLAISEKYNIPFKYYWPNTQTTEQELMDVNHNSPEFFDEIFVAENEVKDDQYKSLITSNKKKVFLNSNSRETKIQEFLKEENIFLDTNPLFKPQIKKHDLSNAFEKVISEKLKFFREDLYKKTPPKSIGIHYRGGDVIYGPYNDGEFIRNKSLTLCHVEKIIKENINFNIILFGTKKGETLIEINQLKEKYDNISLSSEIIGNNYYSQEREVINDVILMSLTERIYCAGGSGVTRLAHILGNTELIESRKGSINEYNYTKNFIHQKDFNHYTSEQKVFTYLNLLYMAYQFEPKETYNFIKLAYFENPSNLPIKSVYINAKNTIENENKDLRLIEKHHPLGFLKNLDWSK